MSIHQTIYGDFVEIDDDLLGIVDEIHRLWPTLRVVYLDPEQHHDVCDAPFRIIELCHDGVERKVMDVWQLDRRVIDKLHQMDSVDLDKLVADENAKAKRLQQEKFKEAIAAANDVVAHALHDPRTTYSFRNSKGDLVKLDDSGPTKILKRGD
jgi:hypothetical protein